MDHFARRREIASRSHDAPKRASPRRGRPCRRPYGGPCDPRWCAPTLVDRGAVPRSRRAHRRVGFAARLGGVRPDLAGRKAERRGGARLTLTVRCGPSRESGRTLLLVTIVNACLRDGRGGSPTAVLEEAALTELERRQVPKLTRTSHAVFVSARDGDAHRSLASLRFFTTTGELPGCGHATVAALAFLAQNAGRDPYHVTLRASERSFAGEATRAGGHVSAVFDPGAVQLRQATVDERVIVLDALGRDRDILVPGICVASLGRPRLLVPLSTPTAVARLAAGLRPAPRPVRSSRPSGLPSIRSRDRRASSARMFAPSISARGRRERQQHGLSRSQTGAVEYDPHQRRHGRLPRQSGHHHRHSSTDPLGQTDPRRRRGQGHPNTAA